MSRALYPLAAAALALLAGTAGYVTHRLLAAPPAAPPATLEAAAPATAAPADPLQWQFETLDGGRERLARWAADVVVLNFWATWCPPCLREIPAFVELQQRYAGSGLQFVGIALDNAEQVRPFVAEKGVNYPVVLGDDDVVRLMQTLGNDIGGLPYTVVLAGGRVVLTHQGEWEAAAATETLAKLLKTP